MVQELFPHFDPVLEAMSTPITTCVHIREPLDGKLRSAIPFWKVVPTPKPTEITKLHVEAPDEDNSIVAAANTNPLTPCDVKKETRRALPYCETLCERIHTSTCAKKQLTTAECINVLLGKQSLRSMIESGFTSDMALSNLVAMQCGRFNSKVDRL